MSLFFHFVFSFFLFGVSIVFSFLSFVFLVPIFFLLKKEYRLIPALLVFLFGIQIDIFEGHFPLNTILLSVLFIVFLYQKIIPYMQGKQILFLGFLSYWTLFILIKIIFQKSFFDFTLSRTILFNYFSVLIFYCMCEAVILIFRKVIERRQNVRR
ncbi:MAG: hypothetical protein ACTSXV_00350 [Alphaproteobacteria bacterium]